MQGEHTKNFPYIRGFDSYINCLKFRKSTKQNILGFYSWQYRRSRFRFATYHYIEIVMKTYNYLVIAAYFECPSGKTLQLRNKCRFDRCTAVCKWCCLVTSTAQRRVLFWLILPHPAPLHVYPREILDVKFTVVDFEIRFS